MEKLVLIDGNSLINRAFYAMPVLTTKRGEFTNAVYGFMNMFFKILAEESPQYAAVAFDLKAPTFRHKIYAEYKGTRKPMPEELRPQIPLLKELLSLMGVCCVEKEGSEADDIIGTLAKHSPCLNLIYTGDRDAFQLVDEHTEVRFTRRGITETESFTAQNFTEKTGISPAQIIDLKALMGDASDNIPGIPGVGEKTAVSLIQAYGGLDSIYGHAGELKGKLKERVEENKDSAYLSRTLATIDTDCGVTFDPDKMRFSMPLPAAVRVRFLQLEFKTLYSRTDLFAPETEGETDPENGFNNAAASSAEQPATVRVENLADFTFAAGQEATFLPLEEEIHIYTQGTEYVFPVRNGLLSDGFMLSDVLKALSPVFTESIALTVFSKKEARHLLREAGTDIACPCEDISILKYLADYSGKEEKAAGVIEEYGKNPAYPAFALTKIRDQLKVRLKEENMEKLYSDLELPLADVLFDMENAGFKVDYEALSAAGQKLKEQMRALEASIKEYAGEPNLNINSPFQLGDVLFDKLKLGKAKKTRRGYSTAAEVLEEIEDAHPIVPLILSYRRISKLYSTYIEGFKPLIDKRTGLIHTSFNQTVTSTGRLSSKEPNLQNIPVREEEGKELRKFFVPRDGEHILVGADYSQIELRLLAAFSGCPGLISAFEHEKDVHSETAAKVFGVDIKSVTPEMRRAAKAVNFGIIYGISEYGLAKNLKIPAARAREYIANYFAQYPEVKKYMDENVAFARKNGYAQTMLGRRRYIREINSGNYKLRTFGERAAMNMPLQGSSADIIKLAMLGVHERLRREGLESRLILQIHDELIIDALKSEQQQVEKLLKEEMEGAVKLKVPLTVELGSGETWYDTK